MGCHLEGAQPTIRKPESEDGNYNKPVVDIPPGSEIIY